MTPTRKMFFIFTLTLFALAVAFAPATLAQQTEAGKDEEPAYREYKGVQINMPADEARKKLGDPTDKGNRQDFYIFSDDETAQIFYDAEKKVSAIAVVYTGGKNIPTCRTIFGKEAPAKPDGSQYLRVQYPKTGYWVSYSRTPGDTPVTSVTMQKKQ